MTLPCSHGRCQWGLWGLGGIRTVSYYGLPSAQRPAEETGWQEDKSCRSQPSLLASSGPGPLPPAPVRGRCYPSPLPASRGLVYPHETPPMPSPACAPGDRASRIGPRYEATCVRAQHAATLTHTLGGTTARADPCRRLTLTSG